MIYHDSHAKINLSINTNIINYQLITLSSDNSIINWRFALKRINKTKKLTFFWSFSKRISFCANISIIFLEKITSFRVICLNFSFNFLKYHKLFGSNFKFTMNFSKKCVKKNFNFCLEHEAILYDLISFWNHQFDPILIYFFLILSDRKIFW